MATKPKKAVAVALPTDANEKKKALDTAISQITKQFGAGSMQPKVAAAVQFVRSGWRRRAVIASLAQAPAAMRGESGTRIVP